MSQDSSSLTLRTAFWQDRKARDAFKRFILDIHGLDFTAWESAGYWDDSYTPFSYFDGDSVVASVCIYLLDAIIDGRRTRLAQISGVGTSPEWRRKGLNRRLTDTGLDWAHGRHEGVFLFSDIEAIPFYERCGFQRRVEYVECVTLEPAPQRKGAILLDCDDSRTLERIRRYASARAPISDRLSILNSKLVMFHVLYRLRDKAYEIPDLGCIVFLDRSKDRLRIYDILGERIPTLEELQPYIANENDRVIEFHFHSDKLRPVSVDVRPLEGNNCFVRAPFPVQRPVFPYTSRA